MTCEKCEQREKDIDYYNRLHEVYCAITHLYEHEYKLVDNYPSFVVAVQEEINNTRNRLLKGESCD